MKDDKYIVFKRSELTRVIMAQHQTNIDRVGALTEVALDDAVVIRCQDTFAGPALHAYAASISIALNILKESGGYIGLIPQLQAIADYFADRAAEADATHFKLPD